MKRFFVAAALMSVLGAPALAQDKVALEKTIAAAQFNGEVLVSRGSTLISVVRGLKKPSALWRWASVTKQIVATLVMQEVAAGRIDLDKPVGRYLPEFESQNAGKTTVRQLLQHQSGLPNPDDTPAITQDVPVYYMPGYIGSRDPLTGYCAGPVKGEPGGKWSYNNCDYIVAGALLQAVTGKSWQVLVRDKFARPLGLKSLGAFPTRQPTQAGTVAGEPEPAHDLSAFDASAALYGTVRDLWKFDRALMGGKLLPETQRAEMWNGNPRLGFMALGQWAFEMKLKGCAAPTRLIERRGGIGGVEIRNFIAPDADVIVIAFTNRAETDFGEVWQGKGLSYDLLSAAICTSASR